MIMWTIAAVMTMVLSLGVGSPAVLLAPSVAHIIPSMTEDEEWDAYHAEALSEYSAQFTALFEGYETKWAKNGRLMLRTGDSGPYKFVKRAA